MFTSQREATRPGSDPHACVPNGHRTRAERTQNMREILVPQACEGETERAPLVAKAVYGSIYGSARVGPALVRSSTTACRHTLSVSKRCGSALVVPSPE